MQRATLLLSRGAEERGASEAGGGVAGGGDAEGAGHLTSDVKHLRRHSSQPSSPASSKHERQLLGSWQALSLALCS